MPYPEYPAPHDRIKSLCSAPQQTLELLFRGHTDDYRLIERGDRSTTMCLYALKRLLDSLKGDISRLKANPLCESELIGLLCTGNELQQAVLEHYKHKRLRTRQRGGERSLQVGDELESVLPLRQHHSTNMERNLADKCLQTTLSPALMASKSTSTEIPSQRDAKCGRGSPQLNQSRSVQTQHVDTRDIATITNETGESHPDGQKFHNSAGWKCFSMGQDSPHNNCRGLSDESSSTANCFSDLSVGQMRSTEAATHLIRSDCGLLVFNTDGSLVVESPWKQPNAATTRYAVRENKILTGEVVMDLEPCNTLFANSDHRVTSPPHLRHKKFDAFSPEYRAPLGLHSRQEGVGAWLQPSSAPHELTSMPLPNKVPLQNHSRCALHDYATRKSATQETTVRSRSASGERRGPSEEIESEADAIASNVSACEEETSTLNQISPLPIDRCDPNLRLQGN